MFTRKQIVLALSIFMLLIALVGCGSETSEVSVSSGVIDKEYEGVVNPQIPMEFKLTEEEKKNGVQKVTIEGSNDKDSSDEEDTDEQSSDEEDDGGEERARPNI
ncbi:hypothetical protein [Desulfuribacillus alkaliarsenatis]|uniref:Uncharacterized protein n=1 Tax=Desulfuribacillus alkaliarsenatis TaxID=766136 RepID=A0A1E5FZ31_9FIRM|nr:hypothetical protein [Desulfuribacillus alkaliarsenatis]OEF95830.1 hypothetical protein BHF68_10560 [Desulfuribacillus alkaliarsenatis]